MAAAAKRLQNPGHGLGPLTGDLQPLVHGYGVFGDIEDIGERAKQAGAGLVDPAHGGATDDKGAVAAGLEAGAIPDAIDKAHPISFRKGFTRI